MELSEIFNIKTKEEALLWKERYIGYIIDNNKNVKSYNDALEIANNNIGYFSGYSNNR